MNWGDGVNRLGCPDCGTMYGCRCHKLSQHRKSSPYDLSANEELYLDWEREDYDD